MPAAKKGSSIISNSGRMVVGSAVGTTVGNVESLGSDEARVHDRAQRSVLP